MVLDFRTWGFNCVDPNANCAEEILPEMEEEEEEEEEVLPEMEEEEEEGDNDEEVDEVVPEVEEEEEQGGSEEVLPAIEEEEEESTEEPVAVPLDEGDDEIGEARQRAGAVCFPSLALLRRIHRAFLYSCPVLPQTNVHVCRRFSLRVSLLPTNGYQRALARLTDVRNGVPEVRSGVFLSGV